MENKENFDDLLDKCLEVEEDPELKGNTSEIFRKLLSDYFFQYETYESKSMEFFLADISVPSFIQDADSIFNLNMDEMRTYINGELISTSLCGKIILSKEYLKSFYKNYPPSFTKLPDDVKEEVLEKIKEKNRLILDAFEKMMNDRSADKNRKIVSLVAEILKNVHFKTEFPFKKLGRPARDIIGSIFLGSGEVFTASQKQLADLSDDSNIKTLIKEFYIIRQYKDIAEVAKMFMVELNRYKRRALHD